MSILNQPFQGQLGNVLIEKLDDNYKIITIFSAFAKNSGVLRLKSALERFKINGGKINAFIGIDLDGTSYEALLNLFSLCDSLHVIHSKNMSTIYHSKIYLLENDTSAWCAIGSNNLTGGGLWTNFESAALQEYKLPEQRNDLQLNSKMADWAFFPNQPKHFIPLFFLSSQLFIIYPSRTAAATLFLLSILFLRSHSA